MKLTPKLANHLKSKVKHGEWQGEWKAGLPVVKIAGEHHTVDWMLKNLGIEVQKRYAEHGDMEEQISTGDHEEPGDGVGESQE